jgi:putative FmdB family regulatory protein
LTGGERESHMPLYEYKCAQCGELLEVIQSFSSEPETICPKCGGSLRKLFSAPAIQFKGSGFYKTDYPSASSSSSKSGESTGSDSKSESKSESRTESKSDSTSGSKGESKVEAKSESKKSANKPASE